MEGRRLRRMVGLLKARLPELDLDAVADPRAREGRWSLAQILRGTLVGLMAGCKGLWEAEQLTATLSLSMRRQLRLPRRLADTTARDALCQLDVGELRSALHRFVKAAWRRKAHSQRTLPIQVVALDGKVTALPCLNQPFVQTKHLEDGAPYGLVRTVTAALVSAPGRPCIDAIPIPAHTNEMGHFQAAFASVLGAYGGLFDVVTYDAGALSEANGEAVVKANKDYVFRLRGDHRTMYKLAEELLDPADAVERTIDVLDSRTTVTRTLTLIAVDPSWSYGEGKGPDETVWTHARTFLRIDSEKLRDGVVIESETRMSVSSMVPSPAHAEAVDAPRTLPLGRREQQPPHARHRLRRGQAAVDRGRRERHARRAGAAPDRLHAARALPGGVAALGREPGHPLEGPARLGARRARRRGARAHDEPTRP